MSCEVCHKSEGQLFKCEKCLEVVYCGEACQTQHLESGLHDYCYIGNDIPRAPKAKASENAIEKWMSNPIVRELFEEEYGDLVVDPASYIVYRDQFLADRRRQDATDIKRRARREKPPPLQPMPISDAQYRSRIFGRLSKENGVAHFNDADFPLEAWRTAESLHDKKKMTTEERDREMDAYRELDAYFRRYKERFEAAKADKPARATKKPTPAPAPAPVVQEEPFEDSPQRSESLRDDDNVVRILNPDEELIQWFLQREDALREQFGNDPDWPGMSGGKRQNRIITFVKRVRPLLVPERRFTVFQEPRTNRMTEEEEEDDDDDQPLVVFRASQASEGPGSEADDQTKREYAVGVKREKRIMDELVEEARQNADKARYNLRMAQATLDQAERTYMNLKEKQQKLQRDIDKYDRKF